MLLFCVTLISALLISPAHSLAASVSRRAALATVAAGTTNILIGQNTREASAATAGGDTTTTTTTPSNKPKFQRFPQIRFIAALGDPKASSGTGSETWGLWRDDPGPRGVFLRNFDASIASHNNVAPAGWKFDNNDWWVEEHGLIMSTPDPLPRKSLDRSNQQVLPYKRYVVTGDREVTTIMTVFADGRWELEKGSLYDVTHLPCRSARYTTPPKNAGGSGSNSCQPASAKGSDFPVKPGAEMPGVPGCDKQDYAVLFVLGEEA